MTHTQLSYILEVFKTGHFGKAATNLHVTQPTLSMQIQKLEDFLGVEIFDRKQKPIKPTTMGLKIIEQAKYAVAEMQKISELVDSEKTILTGTVRLGVIPTVSPFVIPLFIERMLHSHPKLEFVIQELETQEIVRHLKNESIDFGLLATPLHYDFIFEDVLYNEPFVAYFNSKDPLLKKTNIKTGDLSKNDLILLKEGHCFRDQALEVCNSKPTSKHKNVIFEAGQFDTLMRLVDRNLGYTLLPYLAVKGLLPEQIKRTRLFENPMPSREISLVYNKSFIRKRLTDVIKNGILFALEKELSTVDIKKTRRIQMQKYEVFK